MDQKISRNKLNSHINSPKVGSCRGKARVIHTKKGTKLMLVPLYIIKFLLVELVPFIYDIGILAQSIISFVGSTHPEGRLQPVFQLLDIFSL